MYKQNEKIDEEVFIRKYSLTPESLRLASASARLAFTKNPKACLNFLGSFGAEDGVSGSTEDDPFTVFATLCSSRSSSSRFRFTELDFTALGVTAGVTDFIALALTSPVFDSFFDLLEFSGCLGVPDFEFNSIEAFFELR